MTNICGIYKITSPSGKVYIGQSWNITKRWRDYSIKSTYNQRLLNKSFAKYGKENHSFSILHELPVDVCQDVINNYEIFYIHQYKYCGFKLLNCREGGSNGKLSPETIQLMSAKLKGRSVWNKGLKGIVKKTQVQKLKMSLIMKGRTPSCAGVPLSKECIEKRTQKLKGQKRTDQQRANISISMMGKPYYGQNNGLIRAKAVKEQISNALKSRIDNKGELHNMAKLTNGQILEIRQKYVPRIYPSTKLAKEYNVSKTNILHIIHKRIWNYDYAQ